MKIIDNKTGTTGQDPYHPKIVPAQHADDAPSYSEGEQGGEGDYDNYPSRRLPIDTPAAPPPSIKTIKGELNLGYSPSHEDRTGKILQKAIDPGLSAYYEAPYIPIAIRKAMRAEAKKLGLRESEQPEQDNNFVPPLDSNIPAPSVPAPVTQPKIKKSSSPPPPHVEAYHQKLLDLLRHADKLDEKVFSQVKSFTLSMRDQILARAAEVVARVDKGIEPGWGAYWVPVLVKQFEDVIKELGVKFAHNLTAYCLQSADLGIDLASAGWDVAKHGPQNNSTPSTPGYITVPKPDDSLYPDLNHPAQPGHPSAQLNLQLPKLSPEDIIISSLFNADLITKMSAENIAKVSQQVKLSVTLGESPARLINRLSAWITKEPWSSARAKAEVIARTEMARIQDLGRKMRAGQAAKKYPEIPQRQQWVCAPLLEWPCPKCKPYDGLVYELDGTPYNPNPDLALSEFAVHGEEAETCPPIPLHPNCRCTLVPWVELLPEIDLAPSPEEEQQAEEEHPEEIPIEEKTGEPGELEIKSDVEPAVIPSTPSLVPALPPDATPPTISPPPMSAAPEPLVTPQNSPDPLSAELSTLHAIKDAEDLIKSTLAKNGVVEFENGKPPSWAKSLGLDASQVSLSGIPFKPFGAAGKKDGVAGDIPSTYWDSIADNHQIHDPVMTPIPGKKISVGCIMVEEDGSMWLYEPANHFAGYYHTFPKGQQEIGDSLQQTALRETWEETGMEAEILSCLGDYEKTGTLSRYYVAKRKSGVPWDQGWEAQKVKLATAEKAKELFAESGPYYSKVDTKVLEDLVKHLDAAKAAHPDKSLHEAIYTSSVQKKLDLSVPQSVSTPTPTPNAFVQDVSTMTAAQIVAKVKEVLSKKNPGYSYYSDKSMLSDYMIAYGKNPDKFYHSVEELRKKWTSSGVLNLDEWLSLTAGEGEGGVNAAITGVSVGSSSGSGSGSGSAGSGSGSIPSVVSTTPPGQPLGQQIQTAQIPPSQANQVPTPSAAPLPTPGTPGSTPSAAPLFPTPSEILAACKEWTIQHKGYDPYYPQDYDYIDLLAMEGPLSHPFLKHASKLSIEMTKANIYNIADLPGVSKTTSATTQTPQAKTPKTPKTPKPVVIGLLPVPKVDKSDKEFLNKFIQDNDYITWTWTKKFDGWTDPKSKLQKLEYLNLKSYQDADKALSIYKAIETEKSILEQNKIIKATQTGAAVPATAAEKEELKKYIADNKYHWSWKKDAKTDVKKVQTILDDFAHDPDKKLEAEKILAIAQKIAGVKTAANQAKIAKIVALNSRGITGINSSNVNLFSYAGTQLGTGLNSTPKTLTPMTPEEAEIIRAKGEKDRYSYSLFSIHGAQLGGGEQGGQGTYTDGSEWYVKESSTPEHAMTEKLAGELMRLAGAHSATTKLVDRGNGELGIASSWVPGLRIDKAALCSGSVTDLYENFATDCWIANWDCVGPKFNNINVDKDNRAFRLDFGGSLEYSGLGGRRKPSGAFSNTCIEFETLRTRMGSGETASHVFSNATPEQLIESARKLQNIHPDEIRKLALETGFTLQKAEHLTNILENRRRDIIQRAQALYDAAAAPMFGSHATGEEAGADLVRAVKGLTGTGKNYSSDENKTTHEAGEKRVSEFSTLVGRDATEDAAKCWRGWQGGSNNHNARDLRIEWQKLINKQETDNHRLRTYIQAQRFIIRNTLKSDRILLYRGFKWKLCRDEAIRAALQGKQWCSFTSWEAMSWTTDIKAALRFGGVVCWKKAKPNMLLGGMGLSPGFNEGGIFSYENELILSANKLDGSDSRSFIYLPNTLSSDGSWDGRNPGNSIYDYVKTLSKYKVEEYLKKDLKMEYGLSKHEEVDLPDDFVEASKRIYQAPREPEGLLTAAELQFLGDQSADVYKEELAFYEALEANGEVYHMSNHPRDLGFGPGGAPTQEARLQNEKEFWARHAAGLEDEE